MPHHIGKVLLTGPVINQADDVVPHDRTPLFDRGVLERSLVSGRFRRLGKMVSSVTRTLAACRGLAMSAGASPTNDRVRTFFAVSQEPSICLHYFYLMRSNTEVFSFGHQCAAFVSHQAM
jgi:hypothetical protein